MPRAITVEELTPQWLNEVLQREHLLPSGQVIAIEKRPTSAFNSHTLHLQAITDVTGRHAASIPLLLKCNLPEAWAKRGGAREATFYQTVRDLPDHPAVIVHCYDAVYDPVSGNSHILLADLSQSHRVIVERDDQLTQDKNLPTPAALEQAIDALARFHAYWWQHPQLGAGIAPISWGCSDEQQYAAEIARRKRAWDHLVAQESEWFPPQLKLLYENILAQMMPIWRTHMQARVAARSNLTLTHGDAYLANFLCPREGQSGPTYIIDWQCPECYRGSTDLVNLCATFWTRAQRAGHERELNVLRQYHRTLQENGVHGYAWDALLTDYRLSLMDWLWIPVQDRFDGSSKTYWWPKLQNLAAAYEDWRVSDLYE